MAAAVWTACTKTLFYRKKVEPRSEWYCSGVLLFLRAFLRGVLEKAMCGGWFLMVNLWCFAWCMWFLNGHILEAEKAPRNPTLFSSAADISFLF
jgi:hypothetical protein